MSGLYVITGDDEYAVDCAARKRLSSGGSLETVDSLQSTSADAQLEDIKAFEASVMTPPFLEPHKTTWWKNVHFLSPRGGDAAGQVKEALARLAKQLASAPPPENQTVVISGPSIRSDGIFAKTLKGVAEFEKYSTPRPFEAARAAAAAAIDAAAGYSLRFAPGAVETFVATVGTDSRSIHSEVAKLRDYVGADSATIKAEDVKAVSCAGVNADPAVWTLTDALGARDVKAVAKAALLFCTPKDAIPTVSMSENCIRKLIAVKDGEAKGRLEEATEGMTPFAAEKNRKFAAKWTLAELRMARARLVALRERLVGGVETAGGAALAVAVLVDIARPRPAKN